MTYFKAASVLVAAAIVAFTIAHVQRPRPAAAPTSPPPAATAAAAAKPPSAPASPQPKPDPTTERPRGSATLPPGVPAPSTVDYQDPTAVSRAALTTFWTADATLDTTPREAMLRAVVYLTPSAAGQIQQEPPQAAPPGAWRRHRAYGRARLREDHDSGGPADTTTEAYRQWTLTITPTGRDGWHGTAFTTTAFVSLTRPAAGQPWRIADLG
jgi:hypothetical protein